MWAKVKAWCLHSLTIAWSYVLAFFGAALALLPYLVDILADGDVKTAMSNALPSHWLGIYTIGVAAVTYAVRLRTAAK